MFVDHVTDQLNPPLQCLLVFEQLCLAHILGFFAQHGSIGFQFLQVIDGLKEEVVRYGRNVSLIKTLNLQTSHLSSNWKPSGSLGAAQAG